MMFLCCLKQAIYSLNILIGDLFISEPRNKSYSEYCIYQNADMREVVEYVHYNNITKIKSSKIKIFSNIL